MHSLNPNTRSNCGHQRIIANHTSLRQAKIILKRCQLMRVENLLFFYDREKQIWCKKGQDFVIHGQFVSRYPSSKIKNNKCNDSLLGDEQLNDDEFETHLVDVNAF
eukprot:558090_1